MCGAPSAWPCATSTIFDAAAAEAFETCIGPSLISPVSRRCPVTPVQRPAHLRKQVEAKVQAGCSLQAA